MKPVELRRQIFRGPSHWGYGLSYRLRGLDGGGIALFSRPAFVKWIVRDGPAASAGSVAVDDCDRLFWIHPRDCQLYRRDPVNELVEPMIALAECDEAHRHLFGRMLYAADRLWILDRTESRVMVLRPDTFQVIAEIVLAAAIDLAVDGGRLYTLARDGVRVFDLDGRPLSGPHREGLSDPWALGVGAYGGGRWIYVVDRGGARGFLRYDADSGASAGELAKFADAGDGFRPRMLVVHPDGNLFVSDGSRILHEFSPDGGYVGGKDDVSPLTAIVALAVDRRGDLAVASPEGIARYSREPGLAGSAGQFYTRALDNGTEHDEEWHRLDLCADLDEGGALDVYYASTEDAGLAGSVNAIFDRDLSAVDKAAALETVLSDRWKGPHALRAVMPPSGAIAGSGDFSGNPSHSVRFSTGTRRYLWLKLVLSGLAPGAKASVREMRVYYPRLSYLRYLPAVYQQDPVSADFLARFLAMFETVSSGLEATLERIPEVFDPDLAPGEFLDWLGQWLDLGMEEDWPASVKRELIQKAADLYRYKGTPRGLADFIEIVTGTRPIISESFESERPFILGDGIALGLDSRIFGRPVAEVRRDQRTVLGHASVLGATEIRATTQVPVDPFRAAAHRFTVLLDLPRHRFQRFERGLHRIIRDNAPAHVHYDIQLGSRAGLGVNAMLGVNLTLTDPQPFLLGYSALGESVCARRVWWGPEVGIDATLGGPEDESNDAMSPRNGER